MYTTKGIEQKPHEKRYNEQKQEQKHDKRHHQIDIMTHSLKIVICILFQPFQMRGIA